MNKTHLTKRVIDGLVATSVRATIWDSKLAGFGLRIAPSGDRVYILKYRIFGQQRWFTIGRHGSPWTPEMARKEATRLLGLVATGVDPTEERAEARKGLTISELCDVYLAEGTAHKKASTLKADRARISHHIVPLLGRKRVDHVARADIERLLVAVQTGQTAKSWVAANRTRRPGSTATGGNGVASQCVALLSVILNFAVARGLRPDNPARGVKKPPVRMVERFLSSDELARLADALRQEERTTHNPYPGAAIRLLLLTGARRSEILTLQWDYVDFERYCLRLPDSKTGAKVIYLSPPALELLVGLPRQLDNPYVFPGQHPGKGIVGIDKIWFRVRASASLQNVRLHDLRHSFASIGAGGGLSLPIIGALLGHKHAATTARYAHLSADPVRAANDLVGKRIAEAMARSADKFEGVAPIRPQARRHG